jgi:ribosomal protein S18 acetylase RimI-like enzyme
VENPVKAIRLEQMDETEFCIYRDAAVRAYAEDKQRSGDWARRDALTLSLQAFYRSAPGGPQTPNQHLFTIHDAETDLKVGWLWYQLRDDGLSKSVYLSDIWIFDEYQRQGYGTATLTELDDRAKSLGVGRVGLHVFGHNTEALELYQRCGYRITDCVMAKDLP